MPGQPSTSSHQWGARPRRTESAPPFLSVGAPKNARRIVASARLCPWTAEQRQHLVPDPFRRWYPTGPQTVGTSDRDVFAGVRGRRLALGGRHVTDPERFGQVANPVEEA